MAQVAARVLPGDDGKDYAVVTFGDKQFTIYEYEGNTLIVDIDGDIPELRVYVNDHSIFNSQDDTVLWDHDFEEH